MNGVADVDDPVAEDELEQEHFLSILQAYAYYEQHSLHWIRRQEENFQKLPETYKALIEFEQKFKLMRAAVQANYAFIKELISPHEFFENRKKMGWSDEQPVSPAPESDMDKVKSTLRQFVRDWSQEGAEERSQIYEPILDEFKSCFPPGSYEQNGISVLVPGAGLARLAWEICRLGPRTEGNEWSYFMLIASQYILNRSPGAQCDVIYPWVHQTINVIGSRDLVRPISVPDISPASLPEHSEFSMVAGDFLEVYRHKPEAWDCVVTCFFIDTAHNILEYVRVIHDILKPNGVWINFGPLLYHYADSKTDVSIEISYEELRSVIERFGFTIQKEQFRENSYAGNVLSMMSVKYKCSFFTAIKAPIRPPSPPS